MLSRNMFTCPADFCSDERPFCYHLQCLPSCPHGTYNDYFTCVTRCSDERQLIIEKNCTAMCPDQKPLIEDEVCVSVCSRGMYLNQVNNTCMVYCEKEYVVFNWTCRDACPPDFPYKVLRQKSYYNNLFGPESTITEDRMDCVDSCPETTIIESDTCLLHCPEQYVSFNQTCVQSCPSSHNLLMALSSDYNTIAMCVDYCPLGFVLDDRTCAKRCPDDKFVENQTCVYRCSKDAFLCHSKHCSSPDHKHGNKACVLQCPTGHSSFNGECVKFCSITPNKFSHEGVCVTECPANLSNGYDKTCVEECPVGQFIYRDYCTSWCPYNTALVNGTCFSSCPEHLPYKYTYTTKGYYYWQTNTHVECVSTCPKPLFHQDKICASECSGQMFTLHLNNTCVNICPANHPHVFITMEKSKTIYECVDEMPPGSFELNGTFYNYCPEDANYASKNSCFVSCPNKEDYKYSMNNAIHCVQTCPGRTFIMNDTCLLKCPVSFRILNNTSCQQICPTDFPYEYEEKEFTSSQIEIKSHCLAECPEGTVKVKSSCQTTCPEKKVILNGECVEKCPIHHFKYFRKRKVVTLIVNHFRYIDAEYCIPNCNVANSEEPCVVSSELNHYLIIRTCNPKSMESGNPYIKETNRCSNLTVYNLNGTLLQKCPRNMYVIGKECVSSCPKAAPIKLQDNKKGTLCVPFCPSNFYLHKDTYQCISTCREPQIIFGSTCLSKCPESHPYTYSPLFSLEAFCYDVCPKYYTGDPITYECSLSCDGYEYDKKCYKECPPGTFHSKEWLGDKSCESLQLQIWAIIICAILLVGFILWIVCCSLETGTLKSIVAYIRRKLYDNERRTVFYIDNPVYDSDDETDVSTEV